MFPPKEKKCHLTGFRQSCSKLVQSGACSDRWARITGYGQDGKEEDFYGCVDDFSYKLDLDRGRRLLAIQEAVEKRVDMLAQHVDGVANAVAGMAAQAELQHRQSMALIEGQHDEAIAISTGCRPLRLTDQRRALLEHDDGN